MVPSNSKPSKFWSGGMVPYKQKLYKSKGGGYNYLIICREFLQKLFSFFTIDFWELFLWMGNVCVVIICIDSEAKG